MWLRLCIRMLMLVRAWLYQWVTIFVMESHGEFRGVPKGPVFAKSRTCRGSYLAFIVAGMNDSGNAKQPSKKILAVRRAGEIRRRRIAVAREREAQIEDTAVGVITAHLAIEEANVAISGGVMKLRAFGETPESIAELCGMRVTDVRTALAAARKANGEASAIAPRPA